jgi:ribose/xylose/arabinose/galactoside ABC-type transport system permease subunit
MSEGLTKVLWAGVALGTLLLFNALVNPAFFQITVVDGHLAGSLIDVVERAVPVLLVALGMTLVIATGGVDLSVGAVMAMAGSLAAVATTQWGWSLEATLVLTLAVSTLAGAWNGGLVALAGIQPIVATLILMVAGRGIAQLLTDGQILSVKEVDGFAYLGGGYFMGLPVAIFIALLMALVTFALCRGTALGLFVAAAGSNEVASRNSGLNVKLIRILVYAFAGLCAGLAGLIYTSDITAADANNAGLYLELDAILAVVIGGTALTGGRFFLPGSIVGAFIIQTLTTTILMTKIGERDIPAEFNLVVKALVVLIVCLIQADAVRAMFKRRAGQ